MHKFYIGSGIVCGIGERVCGVAGKTRKTRVREQFGESAQVLVLVQVMELVAVLVTVVEDRVKDWVWEQGFLVGEED